MKKIYIKPEIEELTISMQPLLTLSPRMDFGDIPDPVDPGPVNPPQEDVVDSFDDLL